ncbi:hypothetical protein QZK48_08260 [Acinetobacter baumannii]|nr:hypothetical protein [Acinetobacter baumannii]
MTKIRTYKAVFENNKFNFPKEPYDENNFPSSGFHGVDAFYIPIEVESKTDRVFIFAPNYLNEHEIKKLKDDWEVSDVNF